ncbi:MAG: hypothetical protein P9L92_07610 [Candidatus Electryonea clarkiae]|nr:hypothetical protein [Candidatus Electryonea clarkiae]MDP8288172.1 hypothetical protein [Candidatus Electryonea clarkiae]
MKKAGLLLLLLLSLFMFTSTTFAKPPGWVWWEQIETVYIDDTEESSSESLIFLSTGPDDADVGCITGGETCADATWGIYVDTESLRGSLNYGFGQEFVLVLSENDCNRNGGYQETQGWTYGIDMSGYKTITIGHWGNYYYEDDAHFFEEARFQIQAEGWKFVPQGLP